VRTFTYRELRDETAQLAGALAALGVEEGGGHLHADGARSPRAGKVRVPSTIDDPAILAEIGLLLR